MMRAMWSKIRGHCALNARRRVTMNVGNIDRGLRGVLGVLLVVGPVWNFMDIWTSATMSYLALAIGAVLIATAVFGFCPMYKLLGVSTQDQS